jgi:hypothetical protein
MAMDPTPNSSPNTGEQHCCSKCNRTFDKPKLIQYYVCPHCLNKLEEKEKLGCQNWFGYLNQKEGDQPIPKECIECEKAVECMLSENNSEAAVSEIKKWY